MLKWKTCSALLFALHLIQFTLSSDPPGSLMQFTLSSDPLGSLIQFTLSTDPPGSNTVHPAL